jgi:hypothetical protein
MSSGRAEDGVAEQPAGAQGAAPLRPGPAGGDGDDSGNGSGGDTGVEHGGRNGAHPRGVETVPGPLAGSDAAGGPSPGAEPVASRAAGSPGPARSAAGEPVAGDSVGSGSGGAPPAGGDPDPGHLRGAEPSSDYPVGPAPLAARSDHSAVSGYPDYPGYLPYPWHPPRPRVVVRADLIPAVSVMSTVALLGFALAWLWSVLAPPVRVVIGNDGQPFPLAAESYHRADDLVIFVLLGLAAGLCSGVGVWFLRERRGPVVMAAAVLGSVLGGWLATALGTAWAEGRYPAPGEVRPLDVVEMAPRLESMWVLLAWPLTTALAYGVLAAWNSMDDLGRRLG